MPPLNNWVEISLSHINFSATFLKLYFPCYIVDNTGIHNYVCSCKFPSLSPGIHPNMLACTCMSMLNSRPFSSNQFLPMPVIVDDREWNKKL